MLGLHFWLCKRGFSLSDDHQTIVKCLSDVPTDICQLPPDICPNPTRHLSTSTRHLSKSHQTSVNSHQTSANFHQTSIRQVPHLPQISVRYVVYVWYKCGTCLTDVWLELADVLWGIWPSSDNHMSGSTKQIATVWWKRWSMYCESMPFWKSEWEWR